MDASLETVELDRIQLPPIPGALPPSFFTDIPPVSAAIFSTVLGTRPFRPLPNPVPVHAVRSGSENDIREKANYLFKRYPTIAESILAPPTAWQDLYQYFDATDLWTEGAGFLFHVLGHIVTVNLTKLNFIENYAREWAFMNEARLANMVPRQDILSSLQTPDDHAWFDYGNMTSHDKEILNSILKWHCEAFQTKRTSAPVLSQNEAVHVAVEGRMIQQTMYPKVPVQMVVEAQRIPYDMSADPYQHFGSSDYKIPPGLSNKSSQPKVQNWELSESQNQASSILRYRNRNTIQPYGGYRGPFHENPHQVALSNGLSIAESHYVPPEGYYNSTNDRRQSARGGHPHGPVQRQPSLSKDPVYVLDPQKSLMSLHKEAFGVQGRNYTRTSPVYPSQRPQSINFQGRNSQDRREEMQYFNNTIIMSNDARFHHDGRFNPINGSTRSIPRENFKHAARKISWPESDFNKVRTVYINGFPTEQSSRFYLEKLFSECGEIINVSVFDEKFFAFITFKNPSSALAAISRFNGYPMEGGKSLTVRYSKASRRKPSHGNVDAQQPIPGAPLQSWDHGLPSAPMHDAGYDTSENRKLLRTTPLRTHAYSPSKPSHALPPNPFEQAQDNATISQEPISIAEAKHFDSQIPNLPAKPQNTLPNSAGNGSPSTTIKAQLNFVQGPLRTPDKTQHGASLRQMSSTARKDSVDRSGQSGGRRPYGSENSKTLRKTPKKQKPLPNDRNILGSRGSVDLMNSNHRGSTSTHSPGKKISPIYPGNTNAESGNTNIASNKTSPSSNAQFMATGGSFNHFAANDVASQLQDCSACSSECPQIDSSASNSDARSDSVSSVEPECRSASDHSSGTGVGTITHQNILAFEIMQSTASEATSLALASVVEPLVDPKGADISTDIGRQQKKKKLKNRKRSPNQSSRSNMEITVRSNIPHITGNHPKNEAKKTSKEDTRSHLKTESNTTSSSAASTFTQIISANAEAAVSPTQIPSNRKASPGRNAVGDSTPREAPRWQSHRTKRSTQSKSSDDDDLFQHTNLAPFKHAHDAKRLSQGNIAINSPATPSTGNRNSSPKNARSQDCEESQTPTRKPQPRHRNNKSDPKAAVPNRKENKKPSQSPAEILSDPSNWPALGSTKLQVDTKAESNQKTPSIMKPLGELQLPPARRDSMASIISQPPQIVRRLTIDSPNSPVSGGSPLWPVVKRWDGHGRLLVENSDSTPST